LSGGPVASDIERFHSSCRPGRSFFSQGLLNIQGDAMTRLLAAALMLSPLLACVADRPITDNQACPCAPGWSCDTSRNVCVVSNGRGGSSGSAGSSGTGGSSDGSTGRAGSVGFAGSSGSGSGGNSAAGSGGTQSDQCAATCSTPAGTVATLSRVEDVYAALEGRWGVCNRPWGFGAPADVIGVEFGPASTAPTAGGSTVGGDFYYLVSGPSGPERGRGFDYQLKYDVSPEGPSSFQLNIHPTPNSGFGGSVRSSPCPKELELNLLYDPAKILVPIGDGSGFGTGGTGGTSGASGTGGKGGTGGASGASGAGGVNAGGGTGGGKSYPLSFTCDSSAGTSCPANQPCPEVPLSATSCGDIPGVLGHQSIPQTVGRPVGCVARLPYGNPYYLDAQVLCTCMVFSTGASSNPTNWVCAL
jgi:hypothetical protein